MQHNISTTTQSFIKFTVFTNILSISNLIRAPIINLTLAHCFLLRVVFVGGGGSRGTSPSLDLTFHPTGLSENFPARERVIPVTAEILLNCSSYQSTLSKGLKQIVFNFDSCYASSASNGPILHSLYYLFIVHVGVSTSFVFYVHPLCRLTHFLFLTANSCNAQFTDVGLVGMKRGAETLYAYFQKRPPV